MAQKISRGVHLYADFDARGIGMKARGPNGVQFRFLEVPTPAWFPDSFLRSLKRNLYFNMVNSASFYGTPKGKANDGKSLDFYKDDSSGNVLTNLVNTAVRSIVTTAANQVTSVASKVDSVINGVSSLFGGGNKESGDLYARIADVYSNPFMSSQPYLKVYGIHLAENVSDTWATLKTVGSAIVSAFTELCNEGPFNTNLGEYFSKVDESVMQALKSLHVVGNDVSDKTISGALSKMLETPEYRMHNFAEQQMLASMAGYYTMTCKLPYFGNRKPAFTSSGESAFRTGFAGKRSAANDPIQAAVKVAQNWSNVTWSEQIRFAPEDTIVDYYPVSYAFNIYNDTLEHAMLNLAFIWSFTAVTQAVTDIVTIRPPYLFDIEVPGGVRYKYCTCRFEATPEGKLRRIASALGSDRTDIKGVFKSLFGFDVNPDAIAYVPDFYKISITFRPLVPNLWNFIYSYLHNAASTPMVGDEVHHLIAQLVKDFKEGDKGNNTKTNRSKKDMA